VPCSVCSSSLPLLEEAINELAKDKSIKILNADKGNVTVVMETMRIN
jgi:hypothetical protein